MCLLQPSLDSGSGSSSGTGSAATARSSSSGGGERRGSSGCSCSSSGGGGAGRAFFLHRLVFSFHFYCRCSNVLSIAQTGMKLPSFLVKIGRSLKVEYLPRMKLSCRHASGCAVIERDETATIHPSLSWEPWQNVAKRGRTWQNLKGLWDAGEYTCFPSHYGPPPSFVTASYVLSRFVAFTPFYYSLKIWPGTHGNHGLSRLPIPSPALSHVHPVLSTGGLKRDCRGRREHSVNVALHTTYQIALSFRD